MSTGLPSQKARAAGSGTPARRIVTAIGAVQQVHIIPGSEASPPTTEPPSELLRPSSATSQRRGTRTSTAAATTRATTSAFHTAPP